jgi:hypothetical protein
MADVLGNRDARTIEPNPSISECWLSSALRTKLDKTEHMATVEALFPARVRNERERPEDQGRPGPLR